MRVILFLSFMCSLSNGSFAQITFEDHIVLINSTHDATICVFATDIDGDGDIDILGINDQVGNVFWFENLDGLGTFGAKQTISTSIEDGRSVYATDLDNDGDMDVLSASQGDDKIAWYENIDGAGDFGPQQIISYVNSLQDIYPTDLDGDGDMDVLSISNLSQMVAWYENIDGQGNFGDLQIISTEIFGGISIYAADIDGDGDMDVLSASFADDKIAWYENTDGLGSFGDQQIITTNADKAYSVFAVDIDGDGDVDILSASRDDDKIAWYKNTDGLGSFSEEQIITTNANGATSVYAVDIDGDGDIDVLSASLHDDKIAWYENIGGLGNFGDQQIITSDGEGPRSVFGADINGDGDMDVVSAYWIDEKVSWHENNPLVGLRDRDLFNKNPIIFPMPTTGLITINSEISIAQIEVYDGLGQLILRNTNKSTIDLSDLIQGLYFCKIKDRNGNFNIQKVIKS